MRLSGAFVAGFLGMVGCSGGAKAPTGELFAAEPGGKEDSRAQDDITPPTAGTFATRLVMTTELSLGLRGFEVLCPDPQALEVRGTYLSRVTHDMGKTRETAELCELSLPSFTVSARGGLGGCETTREASIAAEFDLASVVHGSELTVPQERVGALPVAFVMGAELLDPFSEELPSHADTAFVLDDDEDGNPGVTLVAQGLPIIPDGAGLFAAARLLVTPLEDGKANADLELSLLGSDAGLSGRTLELLAPNLRAGLLTAFERVEVAPDTTCDELADFDFQASIE